MSVEAKLGSELINGLRHTLSEGTRKIEHCVSQLSDEQLWWRPRAEMNSIANLLLHLCGNLRQWIIAGSTGAQDTRNRPREFGDRSNRPKAEMLRILKDTLAEVDKCLCGLDAATLVAQRRIQGSDTTVLAAVLKSVSHFQGHVQEIIHMTREQLGGAYAFDYVPTGAEQISAFEK